MATNIKQEHIDDFSKKLDLINKQIDKLKDDIENAGSAIELKRLEHDLNTKKHELDEVKHGQDLSHEKETHSQSISHRGIEFYSFLTIKLLIILIVIRFVDDASLAALGHIKELMTTTSSCVDEKVSITIIVAGISSSVILLALLMKGVFGTKTETTTSDIPIGAVIKAILAAFKSSGKS
jgi:hypothetical protein